jgi:serine/threonine-protein kinase RsbW
MASRREAVAPMVERVLEAVAPAVLDEEQRENLAVALAEALSNAAVHGNRLRRGSRVRVAVAVTPRRAAVIDVADSGNGFDLAAVSDPTDAERLLVPGGRGVFLMRRLVDELEYNDAGNRVRLTVRARRD